MAKKKNKGQAKGKPKQRNKGSGAKGGNFDLGAPQPIRHGKKGK